MLITSFFSTLLNCSTNLSEYSCTHSDLLRIIVAMPFQLCPALFGAIPGSATKNPSFVSFVVNAHRANNVALVESRHGHLVKGRF